MFKRLVVGFASAGLVVASLMSFGSRPSEAVPMGIVASTGTVVSGDVILLQAAFSSDEKGFTVSAYGGDVVIVPAGCQSYFYGNGCFQNNLSQYQFVSYAYPYNNGYQFPFNYGLYGNYAFRNFFGISDVEMMARDIDTIVGPFTIVLAARINCSVQSVITFVAQQEGYTMNASVLCNPAAIPPPPAPIPPAPLQQQQQQIVVQQAIPRVEPQRPVSPIRPPSTGSGGLLEYTE